MKTYYLYREGNFVAQPCQIKDSGKWTLLLVGILEETTQFSLFPFPQIQCESLNLLIDGVESCGFFEKLTEEEWLKMKMTKELTK